MAHAEVSLLRRLHVALLPGLLVLAGLGAVMDYGLVRSMADEAYDQALVSTALGLAARLEYDHDRDAPTHIDHLVKSLSYHHGQRPLVFVVRRSNGEVMAGNPALLTAAAPQAPSASASASPAPVLRNVHLEGHAMRLLTYRYEGLDGQALIMVGEDLEYRHAAARYASSSVFWSNVLMVVGVLLAVTLGLRMALRPLHTLGRRVSHHDVRKLQPLALTQVPTEVKPLVDGLNRLMARLDRSARAQQVFLNTSAHQLRTPLAGLHAQLELMLDEARHTSQTPDPRLRSLHHTAQRLIRLTEQMLALARTNAQSYRQTHHQQTPAVDLEEVLQELATQYLDMALARHLDLGVETSPVTVRGERWMLREMVANLVDNALRHTPAQGEVTLRCGSLSPTQVFLEVEDSGPGIAADARERVFEPFVRLDETAGPGSGLGLAIVREVAHAHDARVDILDRQPPPGLRIRVTFDTTN